MRVPASFFLSVNYPEGPRIDLGLYELLFTIVMTVILFRYNRKPRPPGRIIALAALMYAPARFALDFLRATDVARPDRRYLALTPAQWACLATAALGVYLWRRGQAAAPAAPNNRARRPPATATARNRRRHRPASRRLRCPARRCAPDYLHEQPKPPEASRHD